MRLKFHQHVSAPSNSPAPPRRRSRRRIGGKSCILHISHQALRHVCRCHTRFPVRPSRVELVVVFIPRAVTYLAPSHHIHRLYVRRCSSPLCLLRCGMRARKACMRTALQSATIGTHAPFPLPPPAWSHGRSTTSSAQARGPHARPPSTRCVGMI